jgi:HK97 family phage major capsid protein
MEIKEILESKLEGLGTQIDEKLENALEAQKANLHGELDNLKSNELSALTENYNKLQEQVDSIETSTKRQAETTVRKNWVSDMVGQIKGTESFADQVRTHKGVSFNMPMFSTKAIVNGDADYVDNTSSANVVAPDYQPGIVFDPDRPAHVREFLPTGTTSSDTVRYIKELNYSDGSEIKITGSAAGETTFDLQSNDAPVRTIASHVRVTSEMLDDVAGLTSYLSTRLPKKIRVKEDNVLLYGEGANLPSFTGLTESAAAYADALADSNVNRFDVLTSAVSQVRDDEYMANAIMVHPDDYFNLLLIKDADGMYLMPDQFRFGAEMPRIAGVPLVANTAITTGDFLVGDFSMGAQLFDRQQSSIRFFEQDQDNAIRNVVTVVASERLALAIYRPTAFVYGTFANALATGSA